MKFLYSTFDHIWKECYRNFGSCLLWVMLTKISVDIAVDIAVDIVVDSRSIVGR